MGWTSLGLLHCIGLLVAGMKVHVCACVHVHVHVHVHVQSMDI